MSWLNFNDSLNTLKGQITNFANTVLAEDLLEKPEEERLRESERKRENDAHDNEYSTEDPWTWSNVESKTDQLKTDETITNLKKRIKELQNENRDLIASLDQLDQNHQQNTEELVKMKSKLSQELEIVTEEYEILNMNYNKLALAENGYKKKINELKNRCEELTQQKPSSAFKKDDIDSSTKYELLEDENLELKKKISMLEETCKNSENSKDFDFKIATMSSSIHELQMENKALKIALQTTTELNKTQDNKNTVEEYERELAHLRSEIQHLKHETTEKDSKEFIINDNVLEEATNREGIKEKYNDEFEKLNERIARSEEENRQLTEKYEDEITKLKIALNTIKRETEIEISHNVEQSMMYKTKIDELELNFSILREEKKEIEKNYSDLQQMKQNLEESMYESENILRQYEKQISGLKEVISQKVVEGDNKKLYPDKSVFKKFFDVLEKHFSDYLDIEEKFPDNFDNTEVLHEIFAGSIKSIHKVLVNLQEKIVDLEMRLNEVDINKFHLENEKDKEIERLLHNNGMLTQELSRKSNEMKDIEDECSELMKNNELLISKLNELKETGLQTIFESNEDNVASMEKQLDEDLKRIKELEKLLAQKEFENKRMNDKIIEEERGGDCNDEIIQNLKKIEEEKEYLQTAIDELKEKLRITETERDNCRIVIDKMRIDFETTEYQFSEMNVNLETLSEEIEKHKMRIDLLVSENENLKFLKQEHSKNDVELKSVREELARTKSHDELLQKKVRENEEKHKLEEHAKEEECVRLQSEVDRILIEKSHLEQKVNIYKNENELLKKLYYSLSDRSQSDNENLHEKEIEITKVIEHVNGMKERIGILQEENLRLISEVEIFKNTVPENNEAQAELQNLMASRNELISIVQTKHQETLTYHAEIQRLSEILKQETEKNIKIETEIETLMKNLCTLDDLKTKDEEIGKLNDQIDFLRQKCDVMAQSLLEEQQKTENEKLISSEKEATLSKKLERLQSHLMEVEEHYTQELLQSEQKIASLQARLNEVEKREKDSSTIYTSVSIRANQQNEALTQQLQSMTSQRDEFRKKLLDLEDENNVKSAALSNLQLVLEQFQRDKEADVIRETDRIRRQVKHEQTIQEDLRKEIANLESQIKESKQGLQAALRLTDQLEMSKNQVSTLREEVSVLSDKLHRKEEELREVTSQTDGKVDKSLIKNLVIGFVTSNKNLNKDQKQILKIIATVLDFNEQDHSKVNLNQAHQNTWLHSLLMPMAGDDLPPNESLSRAFVNFLENESKPRVIPSLVHQSSPSQSSSSVNSSTRTTPTPIVLNEIILPTFSDFPQHRNSSSILKGVLKDNS